LQSLKILVERLGHTVVCIAETEEEILQGVNSKSIDLALLDIGMQESDGIVTAGILRNQYNIPTVIISGYGEIEYVEKAARAGVMSYLIKPISYVELQAAIETAIARSREIHNLENKLLNKI
jgi:DNA-binding NarL/FixJ family response regulator